MMLMNYSIMYKENLICCLGATGRIFFSWLVAFSTQQNAVYIESHHSPDAVMLSHFPPYKIRQDSVGWHIFTSKILVPTESDRCPNFGTPIRFSELVLCTPGSGRGSAVIWVCCFLIGAPPKKFNIVGENRKLL